MARILEEHASTLVGPSHFEGRVARFSDVHGVRCAYRCRVVREVRCQVLAEAHLLRRSHTAQLNGPCRQRTQSRPEYLRLQVAFLR
jgi:hypothetical protein